MNHRDLELLLSTLDASERAVLFHVLHCSECAMDVPALLVAGHLIPSMTPKSLIDAYKLRSAGVRAWTEGDREGSVLRLLESAELFAEIAVPPGDLYPHLGLCGEPADLKPSPLPDDELEEGEPDPQKEAAEEASTTRALLGIVLHEAGRPALAISALQTALLPLSDGNLPTSDVPGVHVFAALSLALAHADLDAISEAHQAADNARLIYNRLNDPLDLLRVHWLEARLSARLKMPEAVPDLRLVRDRLVTTGLFREALLATVDLASPLALAYGAPALASLLDSLEEVYAPHVPARLLSTVGQELRRISALDAKKVQPALTALTSHFEPDLRFHLLRIVGSVRSSANRPGDTLLAHLDKRPGLAEMLRREQFRKDQGEKG
jgi:hypothetical protein